MASDSVTLPKYAWVVLEEEASSSTADLPSLYWQPLFLLAGHFEVEEPASHAVFDETLDEARNGLGAIPIPLQFAMDGIPRRRPPASLNDTVQEV